ncbi:glycosyltransferase family 4 protein [Methylobacterium sp. WSM2598]|uniref:glycosyltransferase family 4 protein n=1 Tax=Methylobacterium sp. WSM2598 TaxID=398261 RepID=UPI00036A749F|nr:glycosyltransferase family 4 protein [Methylobacterium sp. WSM2598]
MSPTRRVFITGADDPKNFSGSSYYFGESLRAVLGAERVVALPIRSYRDLYLPTLVFGARMGVDPRKYFFMAREFQEANFLAANDRPNQGDVLVSFPPITPRRDKYLRAFSHVSLLIDMTLTQYFEYSQFKDAPDRVKSRIIGQETRSYQECDSIFVFNDWVADQLVERYRVDAGKIHVIGRGLNMPRRLAEERRPSRAPIPGSPLRVGFVGADAERKGLFDLIEAIDGDPLLSERVHVHAIGPDAATLPARPFLTAHGYIDKAGEIDRIVAIMSDCALGYLFSRAEGIPGSVLEFLSLGVPCLVSDIPAMDSVRALPGVAEIPLAGGAAAVRAALRGLVSEPERLAALRADAAAVDLDGWIPQAQAVANRICA